MHYYDEYDAQKDMGDVVSGLKDAAIMAGKVAMAARGIEGHLSGTSPIKGELIKAMWTGFQYLDTYVKSGALRDKLEEWDILNTDEEDIISPESDRVAESMMDAAENMADFFDDLEDALNKKLKEVKKGKAH